MTRELELLRSKLKDGGYSLTSARQAVFNSLLGHRQLSMKELVNGVPDVNRASVYRVVNLFEALGVINRLVTGWKYKLELSDLFSQHHHHATCSSCGVVVLIQEQARLETSIDELGQSIGFKVLSHSLEIHGLCEQCALSG